MAWLEIRLQELVEGGTSWLLPGGRRRRELAGWLVEIMNDSLRCEQDGNLQAPDQFILTLPGPAATQLDETLLSELASVLRMEAQRRGWVLVNEPIVRVMAASPDSAAKVQVFFSERDTSDTVAIKVEAQSPSSIEALPIGRAYLIIEGGQTFMLTSTVISIGRDPNNALVLSDMRVSRMHAQLRLVGVQYVIFDLQSTGGTTVNGRAVIKQALIPGDVISLAGVTLVYGQEVLPERDATQKLPVEPDDAEKI